MNQDPFWLTDEQFSKIAPHRRGVRFREPPRWPGPAVMGAIRPIPRPVGNGCNPPIVLKNSNFSVVHNSEGRTPT